MAFYYVYLLQSEDRQHHYTGSTSDLHKRLRKHNDGSGVCQESSLMLAASYSTTEAGGTSPQGDVSGRVPEIPGAIQGRV